MREIKFRAWDDERKIMYPADDVYRLSQKEDGIYAIQTSRNAVFHKALILMQFTGLKDKNGKEREIYEDDLYRGEQSGILLLVEFREGEYILTKKVERHPYRVKHCDLHYALSNLSIKYIGDIHTTPELLEQENEPKNPR